MKSSISHRLGRTDLAGAVLIGGKQNGARSVGGASIGVPAPSPAQSESAMPGIIKAHLSVLLDLVVLRQDGRDLNPTHFRFLGESDQMERPICLKGDGR